MKAVTNVKFKFAGTAALMISFKENEIYFSRVSNLIDIVDNAYSKEELIETEYDILKNSNLISYFYLL